MSLRSKNMFTSWVDLYWIRMCFGKHPESTVYPELPPYATYVVPRYFWYVAVRLRS